MEDEIKICEECEMWEAKGIKDMPGCLSCITSSLGL